MGLSYRRLVGRARHLDVQNLWIQEEGEAVILTKVSSCDFMLMKKFRVLDTELENDGAWSRLSSVLVTVMFSGS